MRGFTNWLCKIGRSSGAVYTEYGIITRFQGVLYLT